MSDLTARALGGLAWFLMVLAAMLFVPAGTLRWWQGWLYWAVFSACTTALSLYFLRRDPALVRRRMSVGPAAERLPSQKIIQAAAAVLVVALYVVPGLERRAHGRGFAAPAVWIADALVVVGYAIIFLAFRENSFAASIVEVGADQRVIATGPYAVVRHPMYSGALLMFLATPVALGSWWAIGCAAALAITVGVRMLDEERHLAAHLPGYAEYLASVRYRLIPRVW
jgi:protein-S-isoprenylcysteine O-methyltransferase Ste14